MRIIPVMDVHNGYVVRAVGGDRSRYEVWESDLCPTGEPLPLAFALKERFNCTEVYVADLNAIAGGPPNLAIVPELLELGLQPWVDAGVRDAKDANRLRCYGAAVVVGSESIAGPDAWERVVRCIDGRRLAFSLDLHDGQAIAPGWNESDPSTVLFQAMSAAQEICMDAPSRIFVLDLARVGSERGVGTEKLLRQIVREYPMAEVFAGGGVRGPDDIDRLEAIGVAGALVATALHDGVVQPAQSKAAH